MTTGNDITDANEAAALILTTPSTFEEWSARRGELIHAAYRVARAWQARRNDNDRLADEFAAKGSLKHFMLSQGFMPDSEEAARSMLVCIIRESDSK